MIQLNLNAAFNRCLQSVELKNVNPGCQSIVNTNDMPKKANQEIQGISYHKIGFLGPLYPPKGQPPLENVT